MPIGISQTIFFELIKDLLSYAHKLENVFNEPRPRKQPETIFTVAVNAFGLYQMLARKVDSQSDGYFSVDGVYADTTGALNVSCANWPTVTHSSPYSLTLYRDGVRSFCFTPQSALSNLLSITRHFPQEEIKVTIKEDGNVVFEFNNPISLTSSVNRLVAPSDLPSETEMLQALLNKYKNAGDGRFEIRSFIREVNRFYYWYFQRTSYPLVGPVDDNGLASLWKIIVQHMNWKTLEFKGVDIRKGWQDRWMTSTRTPMGLTRSSFRLASSREDGAVITSYELEERLTTMPAGLEFWVAPYGKMWTYFTLPPEG